MSNKFFYPEKKVDYNIFVGEKNKHIAKYNLPSNVEFCKKCLFSNQRATTRVEHNVKKNKDLTKSTRYLNGICEACRIKDERKDIDWEKKENEFKKILEKYRSRNGSYDVVVPGSGGKDSFYVAHQLKYVYKMNPITITFSPFIYTDWGWKNLQNWINSGFENYLNTPNQKTYSLLSRVALENTFNPWHPWILGQKNFPPKFAKNFNIPLVIYGDSPSEYGNPKEEYNSDYVTDWHTCRNRDEVFISGESIDTLKSFGLKEYEIYPFLPLTLDEFKKSNVKIIAFSYFKNWHPQSNYYYSIENSNFNISPERTIGSHSKYSSIDDVMDHFYFYTYYIKYGLGRTSNDVAQEIRNSDLSIEEGKKLISKYDGEFPEKDSEEVFRYLTIDEKIFGKKIYNLFEKPIIDRKYFDQLSDYFRSPHLWKKTNKGMELRNTIKNFFI